LSQCTHLTDRQTNTDEQTEFSSLDRVCIPCSAVKVTAYQAIICLHHTHKACRIVIACAIMCQFGTCIGPTAAAATYEEDNNDLCRKATSSSLVIIISSSSSSSSRGCTHRYVYRKAARLSELMSVAVRSIASISTKRE